MTCALGCLSRTCSACLSQIANDKALYLQTELAKAFLPAYVCSVYVRRDPAWPAVNASFGPMVRRMH